MGRPPLRTEADAVREPMRAVKRRRRDEDKYAVPRELKQPGQSYEWKRESTMGMEDPQHMNGILENGWEPVQLSEMPHFGRSGEQGVVRKEGLVLMKRPIELTKEARIEDYHIARDQVDGAVARIRGADPTGSQHMPSVGNKVIQDYKSMPSEYATVKTATTQIELQD
jgi:hypothetical protein